MVTPKSCVVCYKEEENSGAMNYDSTGNNETCHRFFTISCGYLELRQFKPEDLRHQTDKPEKLLYLCSPCCQLMKSFCVMYDKWQRLQLKMNLKLDHIEKVMSTADLQSKKDDDETSRKSRGADDNPFRKQYLRRIIEKRNPVAPRAKATTGPPSTKNLATKFKAAAALLDIAREEVKKIMKEETQEDSMTSGEPVSPNLTLFHDYEVVEALAKSHSTSEVVGGDSIPGLDLNNMLGLSVHNASDNLNDIPPIKKRRRRAPLTRRINDCIFCGKILAESSKMDHHLRSHIHEKPFNCPICDLPFIAQSVARRHQKLRHNPDPILSAIRFPCKICGRTFSTKYQAIYHEKVHSDVRERFACKHCGKEFPLRNTLYHHQKRHELSRNFKCKICSKGFIQKHDRDRHERGHTGEKPFKCQYCEKQFTRRRALTAHEQGHTGEQDYQCKFCQKKFAWKNAWETHERGHRNEKPFICRFCPKAFSVKYSMVAHERTHTGEAPPNPHPCEICAKVFSCSSALQRHQVTHLQKPFQCQVCGQGFQEQKGLENHERGHILRS